MKETAEKKAAAKSGAAQENKQDNGSTGIVRISVRSLVEFILRSGDIDDRRGGLSERDAMQMGSRLHRRIQSRMGAGYVSEVPLMMDFSCDDFMIRVEGRADGIMTLPEMTPETARRLRMELQQTRSELMTEDGLQQSQSKLMAGDGLKQSERVLMTGDELQLSLADLVPAETWGMSGDMLSEPENHPDSEDLPEIVIDEIKGIVRPLKFLTEPVPVHLAQAKCYAYFYACREDLDRIGVRMSYANLETEEMKYFTFVYTREELESWFMPVMEEYKKWARFERQWKKNRQESIHQTEFPFSYREGQKKLASDVYRSIARGKMLFIQAPTGVGKTLSTMFPAVKAMGEGLGDKLFYLTAKTIARTVAAEALDQLRGSGLSFKSVVLTAKEKICKCEKPQCDPDHCPYAKGHFDRINDAVYELITQEDVFDRERIGEAADRYMVCPFELSLDLSLWMDAVIGDYNYAFHPRSALKRFFGEGVRGDYLFLVDEAHNLVDRGRDMYSAVLIKEDFLSARRTLQEESGGTGAKKSGRKAGGRRKAASPAGQETQSRGGTEWPAAKLIRGLERINRRLLELKRECDTYQVLESVGTLPISLLNLSGVMEEYLDEAADGEAREKVLDLYFQVLTFLDVCDRLDENYVIYDENLPDGNFMLKLYCVNPSGRLQECFDKARSSILFSGTLLPIDYYRRLLTTRTDNYAVYASSCFDPDNRKVLIGTDTSSLYKRRGEDEYRKIALYISRTVSAKKGNYMVFFPSYRMLEDVAAVFSEMYMPQTPEEMMPQEHPELLLQRSSMSEAEREEFLNRFSEENPNSLIGFCVMGSIFGEGIDLKNDRLIGAVIVGPGLPMVCTEQRILQDYYEQQGEDGFRYAYQCPGMNRVQQAAGRVIRTEQDRGVVLLLDERFARPQYRAMFPREWAAPSVCTLHTVGDLLQDFWGNGG